MAARNLAEILRRFRPTTAPGPAGPAGVPADRARESESELASVFSALQPALTEAARLRDDARIEGDRRRRASVEDAQRVISDARDRLDTVRAEAASARLAQLDEERTQLRDGVMTEADRVRTTVDAHLAALVAEVVAGVWATAVPPTALPAPTPEASSPVPSTAARREARAR